MITIKDWKKSGSFYDLTSNKKLPVQIEEQIYFDMLEVLPPIEWSKTRHEFLNVPLPVQEYFLIGEAYTMHNGQLMYGCFARAYDTKYFFIGFLPKLTN